MGSECNPNKHHYDLSMSRRTRKSTVSSANSSNQNGEAEDSTDQNGESEGSDRPTGEVVLVEQRRTLKALMYSEGKVRLGQGKQCSSLGHHFMEERQLALATKQGECLERGAKLNGMVSHYLKILNHLVKVNKRDSRFGSRKRAIVQLLM